MGEAGLSSLPMLIRLGQCSAAEVIEAGTVAGGSRLGAEVDADLAAAGERCQGVADLGPGAGAGSLEHNHGAVIQNPCAQAVTVVKADAGQSGEGGHGRAARILAADLHLAC